RLQRIPHQAFHEGQPAQDCRRTRLAGENRLNASSGKNDMPIKKILVVDDSPTERFALTEVLTANGFEVVSAENGEDAVVKSKAELPDLILMDVVMPGMNGYQATRTISRDEATRAIPIIICTTKGQE